MGALVGLLGFAGFGVAILLLIVRVIFKKGWAYKKIGVLAGVALVLFIVGMATTPSAKESFDAGREAGGRAAQEQQKTAAEEPVKKEQVEEGPVEKKEQKKDNEPVLVKGIGENLQKQGEGLIYFTIVDNIEVYEQGDKAWAEVKTTEKKDWDDGDWGKEIARLTIAYSQGVFYLDEAIVLNADGIRVASMRNWLAKD